MSALVGVLYFATVLLLFPAVIALLRGRQDWWFGCLAAGCALEAAANCLRGLWGWAAFDAVVVAACAWHWRRERRRRGKRKVTALLGEKSRALRDALVRRAREAARPRPVLRPGLRGAR